MARLNEQEIAINLLTCATNREAAEKSGVSLATIYRLKKKPEFQELLRRTKDEIFHDTMQKAQFTVGESVKVLQSIRDDESAPYAVRASSARELIALGLAAYEDENIVKRVEELEKCILDGRK